MRIIKPNGDIIELNTAEYRELFMEEHKCKCCTPEDVNAPDIIGQIGQDLEDFIKEHPVKVEPVADAAALTMGFKSIPDENEPSQEAENRPQSEENPPVDKLVNEDLSTQENAPKKEEPVIKRSTAKRKLDDGKIFALRRAGWKWDKIADEMGCSIQTAINHFNDYKENRRD